MTKNGHYANMFDITKFEYMKIKGEKSSQNSV